MAPVTVDLTADEVGSPDPEMVVHMSFCLCPCLHLQTYVMCVIVHECVLSLSSQGVSKEKDCKKASPTHLPEGYTVGEDTYGGRLSPEDLSLVHDKVPVWSRFSCWSVPCS